MNTPERQDDSDHHALSPAERRRVVSAALLRPVNLLMLVVGGVIFATTLTASSLAWVILFLTLLTYASLATLAAKDPVFKRRVLQGRDAAPPGATPRKTPDISPERRAHWLPRGETREKVEDALANYRKVVTTIEQANEVTRAVLSDSVPKLHAAADRLVDVAHKKEKAAEAIRNLRSSAEFSGSDEGRKREIQGLENEIQAADTEISRMSERFLELRARIVRISIEDGSEARASAAELDFSLDSLNARLDALGETLSPPDQSPEH